jgi:thiol-disulfide isomerase/thioredoxin
MRTFFNATVFAMTLGLLVTAAGCGGSSDPEETLPAETDLGEATTADPDADGVDGNTEPPLPEVSLAVESVPEAGTAETGDPDITVAAASPEDFQAALDRHKGKVILVDFWATWCAPCIAGLPHTTELAHKNAERGLVVITMCMADGTDDDEKALALKKLKENGVNLENYVCTLGGSDDSFKAYNIGESGLPHYKIYDRTGQLAKELRSDVDIAVTATDVDEHIEKLLGAE